MSITLYFDFRNSINEPIREGSIATISPIYYPSVSGSIIFAGDPRALPFENGLVTFPDVNPNYYLFSAKNIDFETTFSLLVPSGSSGSINGADLAYPPLQGQIPTWIPVSSSFSYSASFAGYAISASEADKLDGQHGSYYRNASNLNAGVINTNRLTGSYNITSSNANTASIITFDGNRSISRTGYIGTNVGGDDVKTFLNNFFFPFLPATIALTNAGTYYYETGSRINQTITFGITSNDETSYGTCSILKNNEVLTDFGIPPTGNTYIDTFLAASAVYQAKVQTNNNGSQLVVSSDLITDNFIFPYLYGMSSTAGLTGVDLYNACSKSITAFGNKVFPFVGNVQFIYFAYPASYADLSVILDPNLFNVFDSFEYSASVPITSNGLTSNWMANYKVYRTKLLADPNGNFTFNY